MKPEMKTDLVLLGVILPRFSEAVVYETTLELMAV
jgi:hypothetical protein